MKTAVEVELMGVEKIGMDVPVQASYPTFVERYFTPRYILNVHAKGDDICVLFHSNRICLITLAPSHPILAQSKRLVKVNYDASETEEDQSHMKLKHRNEKTNRLDIKVSGKKKKGAQILHKMSLLCKVECDDGSVYSIRSGIPGLLVEINERLMENPNLLTEKPSSEGYVAIILPKTLESDRLKDKLMTPEQYKKALEDQDISEEDKKLKEESFEVIVEKDVPVVKDVPMQQDQNLSEEDKKLKEESFEVIVEKDEPVVKDVPMQQDQDLSEEDKKLKEESFEVIVEKDVPVVKDVPMQHDQDLSEEDKKLKEESFEVKVEKDVPVVEDVPMQQDQTD